MLYIDKGIELSEASQKLALYLEKYYSLDVSISKKRREKPLLDNSTGHKTVVLPTEMLTLEDHSNRSQAWYEQAPFNKVSVIVQLPGTFARDWSRKYTLCVKRCLERQFGPIQVSRVGDLVLDQPGLPVLGVILKLSNYTTLISISDRSKVIKVPVIYNTSTNVTWEELSSTLWQQYQDFIWLDTTNGECTLYTREGSYLCQT